LITALLIEDSTADAQLVREALADIEADQITLDHADRLGTGIERLHEGKFDVVVVDLALPDAGQLEAIDRLNRDLPELPVVVLTGSDDEAMAIEALRCGAQDYLIKGATDGRTLARSLRYAIERKRAQGAVENSHLLAAIVESSTDAIISVDQAGTIVSWNAGAKQLLGYRAEEVTGKPITLLVPPDRADLGSALLESAGRGERIKDFDVQHLHKDGTRIDASVAVSPIKQSGRVAGAAMIIHDTRERQRLEAQLRHLANRDLLTGLYNRRYFEQELERQVSHTSRFWPGGAVLVMGLDNFKHVNDSLGHRAGDEVIQAIATLLRGTLPATDLVARVGGDELAVVLPRVDREQARAAADSLLELVRSRPLSLTSGKRLSVTASIGVALLDEPDGIGAEELLINADLAMYEAKDAGRDRVAIYSAARGRAVQMETRLTGLDRIRQALDDESFLLYGQPILDLRSRVISQREVLLRMTGDGEEVIPPAGFLGTAERFGLVQQIDRWVVRRAIGLIAAEQRAGRTQLLEVNISAKSIGEPLLRLIESELERTAIDPASLILEVTETAAIANMAEARRFAVELTSLGCRCALDDFGTGFGAFSHLKYLPVDYIKIDGQFIRNLPTSAADQVLVRSMVEIAQGLGMETIAEFVEEEEALELLGEYGVDYAQGYLVGRPGSIEDQLSGASAGGGQQFPAGDRV
jgi:diguanylate cyclase (GGDEF)-like protein/PAS domain S-box-containing protein